MDNSVGIDWELEGGMGRGRQTGKHWDNCNRVKIKNDFIKKKTKKRIYS